MGAENTEDVGLNMTLEIKGQESELSNSKLRSMNKKDHFTGEVDYLAISFASSECEADRLGSQRNAVQENDQVHSEDVNQYILARICKIEIKIFKPLLQLKLVLFFWYGAAAAILPFIAVYLQQQGLKISELSIIYMILPAVHLLVPTLSGVIADKIGNAKPILIASILITNISLGCILIIPSMNETECENISVHLKCQKLEFNKIIAEANCGFISNAFEVRFCEYHCPENVTEFCINQGSTCDKKESLKNLSLFFHTHSSHQFEDACLYSVNFLSNINSYDSWCDVPQTDLCSMTCSLFLGEMCSIKSDYRTHLYIAILILTIVFTTGLTNCYRFTDVISMSLVKEYNKDLSRERLWTIFGILVCSPLSGYIVGATSSKSTPRNYKAAFFLCSALCSALLVVVCTMKVHINQPSKQMWKNSLTLLKNPDVIAFLLVLFILGANYNFVCYFRSLYLVELNAPSFLLGLVVAMGSIYALPFQPYFSWFISKAGSSNVFILIIAGYVVLCLGYSFLQNPWWSIALEITEILTYHMLWVAVILHCHLLAPKGLTATIIATAGGVHHGIGQGSGSFIGGQIMAAYGARTAYRVLAAISFASGILYFIYLHIRQLKKRSGTVLNKSTTEAVESNCIMKEGLCKNYIH